MLDQLSIGLVLGALFATPIFAGARWAIVFLGNVIAGVVAIVLTSGFDTTLSGIKSLVTEAGAHGRLAVGVLLGIVLIGIVTAILKHAHRQDLH